MYPFFEEGCSHCISSFEGSPRAGAAEYVHRGEMLITPYFDKKT